MNTKNEITCRWCYSIVTSVATCGGDWLCDRHADEYNDAWRSHGLETLAGNTELLDIIREDNR